MPQPRASRQPISTGLWITLQANESNALERFPGKVTHRTSTSRRTTGAEHKTAAYRSIRSRPNEPLKCLNRRQTPRSIATQAMRSNAVSRMGQPTRLTVASNAQVRTARADACLCVLHDFGMVL
jgi:hypothetical protein